MKRTTSTVLYVEEGAVFGGSLVVIANLMRCLDTTQYRAIVVAEMDRAIIQHHVGGNARIYRIRHPFNYVLWDRAMRALRSVRSLPVRKAGIYLVSAVRRTANLAYALKLAIVVLKERVDLVHINNGFGNPEANLVAQLLGRKCVVHLHGIARLTATQKRFAGRVPKVIAISEFVKSEMVSAGVPQDQVVVMPNPVYPESPTADARMRIRDQYGIDAQEMLIGIFGRIVRWKGQLELLRALELILREMGNVTAVVVGDSADGGEAYLDELRRFVEDHGMQGKVVFAGYSAQVTDLYAAMDVVVHASIEPEPFGLVITEAMAQGVPVVASTLGAPREIIDDGHDGLLADPRNAPELASTILRLLRDGALRRTMGMAGKDMVLARYDAKAYVRRVQDLYRQVLAG